MKISTTRLLAGLGAAACAAGLLGAAATTPAHAVTGVLVMSYNVDFGREPGAVADQLKNVMDRAEANRPDVMLLQETKNVDLAHQLRNRTGWTVLQRFPERGSAEGGSSIVFRNDTFSGHSGLRLIEGVARSEMSCTTDTPQTRFIARTNLTLRNGGTLAVSSVHLPPGRCTDASYRVMADRVVTMANSTGAQQVIGGDWNRSVRADPFGIRSRTGLQSRSEADSIDGAYLSASLSAGQASEGAPCNSGHCASAVRVFVD